MDSGLKREIEQKVRAGERLTHDDGVALYGSDDLAWLGGLAHEVRTAKNDDRVVFNVSRLLDALRVEDATDLPEGLTELHVVNALDADRQWSHYPATVRAFKEAFPGVALKAFTATEIAALEKLSGESADAILDELIAAGLDSLTGGGIVTTERDARWEEIHRIAHAKGLKTPSTMVYGHLEEPRHRVEHVLRLRALQDETGGFQTFIPLRHQRDGAEALVATPAEALKTFAVSRLLFDNVPHVLSFWALHGLSLTQLSLNFGADDLDGSMLGTPDMPNREGLLDLIRDAGLTPAERDTRYEIVRNYDGPTPLAERRSEPQPMWS